MRFPARLLSALFLLIALVLLASDVKATLLAHALELKPMAELLAELGAPWPQIGTRQSVPAIGLMARALSTAGQLPAFVPALLLSLASFAMRRRRALMPSGSQITAEANLAEAPPADSDVQVASSRTSGAAANPLLSRPTAVPAAGSPYATSDPEFLPAALEILVAPPSPIAMWLMALISFTVLSGLCWSYFGWLDIHAVAVGKIQPSGHSKVVQPLDAGKVVAIHVENGSQVAAGDVLLELDPTETAAERESQERELESASAEAARRKAAVAAAEGGSFAPGTIDFFAAISPGVQQREQTALAADLAQLRSNLDSLRAQIEEKIATKDRLNASITARDRLIKLYRERVAMRENIESAGAGSRALVIEALQQLESQITTDVGERGQLTEADAAIRSLQRKIEQTVTQFVADQIQKLVETERKRDRLEQDLIKAKSKSDRTLLKSPLDGTVQQLAVTTIGQVVTTGQSLMTIVPLEGPIEVEAMIANKDIGFVKIGQRAVVKVEAFPFTRYGVIDAEVTKVSRDAVDDRDANALTDAATASRPQPPSTTPHTQNLFFSATLRLAHRNIIIDGKPVPLTPGMAVTVEIKTGERRAIDYVLSPLKQVVVQSAHER